MSKIQRLNEHITNMIAAGEVVERPMGIVKECVENAIDAHASTIEVHIEEGGLSKITIIDDGDGMDFHDAEMAFERHATSKIKKEHDLWNIHSLGFRGEAIPSIASVAQVDLKTNNGEQSTLVQVHYGKKLKHEPIATPKGTQIDISNLFQKTPARFKHLKTTQYEFSLISDVIQKFALGYPNIAFRLVHNQVETFKTTGRGNLQEVLLQIYGRDIAKAAIAIDCKDDDYHVTGYIIQPHFNRATKYYMYVYMNHRMIRHQRLYKAIKDAYNSYMPHDRYPIAVLNVEMDAQLIDVNVHPSKWEVRLQKEKQLENLVYSGIQEVLRKQMQIPEVQPKVEKVVIETPTFDFSEAPKLHQEINESFEEYRVQTPPRKETEKIQELLIKEITEIKKEPKIEKKEMIFDEETTVAINPSFPTLRVIGQFHSSYILAEGEKGLYIIDQHAAQEKYHFEQLSKNIFKKVKCNHF